MPPPQRQGALSSFFAKMDKFRFGLRRSDASSSKGQSVVSSGGAPRSLGGEPVRWCERAESENRTGGSGLPGTDDEVILADFDREDALHGSSSRDNVAVPDWPNSSSWPSGTPGPANAWPMGNTDSILPGTVNTGDESPAAALGGPRQIGQLARVPMAPVSSPCVPTQRSGPSAGGPLAPLTVRPVPAPVPNLVAALPGSITTAPTREHREPCEATVWAPPGGPKRNKRIVYSDPVVQWGFRGPAIKSAIR